MARARNIKPGFYDNELLAECSFPARLLFPALWMLADRDGYLEDRPRRIKKFAFGYDSIDIPELLDELRQRGFIEDAEPRNGQKWFRIPKFHDHQNPHWKEPARYKAQDSDAIEGGVGPGQAPDKPGTAVRGKRETVEGKRGKGIRKRGKGSSSSSEKKNTLSPSRAREVAALIDAYPEHRRSSPEVTARVIASVIEPAGMTVAQAIERVELWKRSDEWGRGVIHELENFFAKGRWLADPPELKNEKPRDGPSRRIKRDANGEPMTDANGAVLWEIAQ